MIGNTLEEDLIKCIKESFDYNKETGELRWKISYSNRKPVGSVAGHRQKRGGQRLVRVKGKTYSVGKIAWLFIYGEFPQGAIIYIDGDLSNNCASNLKLAEPFSKSEYGRKYREKYREKMVAYGKEYYAKNKQSMDDAVKKRKRENPERVLWQSAKERSIKFNVPFSITPSDIIIPEMCPILGIPLFKGSGKPCDNSPSLDRIIPEKGYVIGNIQVVSFKANTMKSSASVENLLMFSFWVLENYLD